MAISTSPLYRRYYRSHVRVKTQVHYLFLESHGAQRDQGEIREIRCRTDVLRALYAGMTLYAICSAMEMNRKKIMFVQYYYIHKNNFPNESIHKI